MMMSGVGFYHLLCSCLPLHHRLFVEIYHVLNNAMMLQWLYCVKSIIVRNYSIFSHHSSITLQLPLWPSVNVSLSCCQAGCR